MQKTTRHEVDLPCTILESVDLLALLPFSLTSAHEAWASFFSSIEDESDCLVEIDDRDGWRVESEWTFDTAAGLASRRLGRLKVIFVVDLFDCKSVCGLMVGECLRDCFFDRL